MSCKTAIGVAEAMKKDLGNELDLKICTNDSDEARAYNLKSSTSVFVNEQLVQLDTALSIPMMRDFLERTKG